MRTKQHNACEGLSMSSAWYKNRALNVQSLTAALGNSKICILDKRVILISRTKISSLPFIIRYSYTIAKYKLIAPHFLVY